MNPRKAAPAAVALALAACGGGGGGNIPLPNSPACLTSLETPRAFANLAFESPVAMKQAPNDASRWFVAEQGGRIRAFDNDPDADTAADFADLRGRVHLSGEAGLLGMAFHPDFTTNGLVYLNFSELVGGAVRSVTAEFASADGGQTLAPASERVLLTVAKPATNHNGGNLEFGPDGFLYLGLGDGGGAADADGNAQNPQRLLGKVLRIDVDAQPGGAPYGIPDGPGGNPFAANPLCNADGTGLQNCPEIFALGFRNPWRWSFDRQNGDLWLGDVGEGSWEEIDLVVSGGNYGWNIREGAHCFEPASGCQTAGLIDPVALGGEAAAASSNRAFKGTAAGVVVDAPAPGTLVIDYVGNATHLGRFTRREVLQFTGPGTFQGTLAFIAANGDQLDATLTGGFVSANDAVGTYTITGGTGRFSDATGTSTFAVTTPDFVHVSVTFDGTIGY
jgi:glucose/arabinose dehydrogenase